MPLAQKREELNNQNEPNDENDTSYCHSFNDALRFSCTGFATDGRIGGLDLRERF